MDELLSIEENLSGVMNYTFNAGMLYILGMWEGCFIGLSTNNR
jgi:hypothetical protein